MDPCPRSALCSSAVALLVVTSFALAHPDELVVDGTLQLAPGETVAFSVPVHYHRLVATYRLHDPASEGVTLTVTDARGRLTADHETPLGTAEFTAPLRGEGRLHHLIECCFGVDYADFEVRLRNDGGAPAALDLRAWVVHDEFAVVVHRAEGGALEVPLVAFLGVGVVAAMVSLRQRRREGRDLAGPDVQKSVRGAVTLGWSMGLFVWACLMALGLGVAGASRYGTGLVDGVMAIMADVPVPGGPFGSRAATVMGVLMLVWLTSIALWIRSVQLGVHRASAWPSRLGMALAVVSLFSGVAMGWTYGSWVVPIVLGLVLAVPLALSSLSVSRRLASAPAAPATS